MIAALAVLAWSAAVASITYYVLAERQRRREVSAAARLDAWERIARRHAVIREDAQRVSQ
jgi:hypothetical protein